MARSEGKQPKQEKAQRVAAGRPMKKGAKKIYWPNVSSLSRGYIKLMHSAVCRGPRPEELGRMAAIEREAARAAKLAAQREAGRTDSCSTMSVMHAEG